METTGVVRRIDGLGRIVIPKEIRKNLRIQDGASLEIFVENDMVTLKKYSTINNLSDFAEAYVEAINSTIKKDILITDLDRIIASSGPSKKKYQDKNISNYVEECIKNRNVVISNETSPSREIIKEVAESINYIIVPIISDSETIGSVIIISKNSKIIESDEKAAEIAATFLGKHIEE